MRSRTTRATARKASRADRQSTLSPRAKVTCRRKSWRNEADSAPARRSVAMVMAVLSVDGGSLWTRLAMRSASRQGQSSRRTGSPRLGHPGRLSDPVPVQPRPRGWLGRPGVPPEARRYYEPVDRGYEAEIKKRMAALRKAP